jgi:hypothetical protein
MSQEQLLALFKQLDEHLQDGSMEESEHRLRIAEIIESLERQQMQAESFDQFSAASVTVKQLLETYENKHPTISGILRSLSNALSSMGI